MSTIVGRELAKEINGLGSEVAALTVDVAVTGTRVLGGTARGVRNVVTATSAENIKDITANLVDVTVGDEIGTTRKTIAEAVDNGNVIGTVFNYALDTIHGKKEYRDAVAAINKKIATAENELDLLINQQELAELELEATQEIARLNKEAEANKAKA